MTETQPIPAEGRAPLRLRVARVVEETPDARSFELEVPSGVELPYRPGQYVTVEMPFEGMRIRRCYSLSSAPVVDAALRFTVKRVAGGRMSNLLVDGVREGDTLTIHPPAGGFVLDDEASRPLSFFAGGSGITPVHSLIKAALAGTSRSIRLLYANRDAASTIFARELDALAAAHPDRFELRHHHDDAEGLLTADALDAWIRRGGTPAGADHYVCGPGPFMEAVREALLRARVPEARIRIERFVSPLDPDRRASDAVVVREAPADFLVTLDKVIHRVPYAPTQTLLAACKAAGVKAPSSCEDGFCGSCMAQLVEGDVDLDNPLALSDADVARGRILACQARPKSARFLHVDFDQVSFRTGDDGGIAARIDKVRVAAVVALGIGVALLVRWLHGFV
ncbi:MAG: ferredoxin--NADP reductase [Myxococcales bacterium]|nr:ferredoxin--NADP reductase [Myxococcales bacterium]